MRVGRHRVPVADLDPRALLQQAGQSPQLGARWPQSAGVDLSDAPLLVRPPVLGGGSTEPVGAQSLLLLTRDGQWRRVPTRRPDDLLQALLTLTVR